MLQNCLINLNGNRHNTVRQEQYNTARHVGQLKQLTVNNKQPTTNNQQKTVNEKQKKLVPMTIGLATTEL